MKEYDEYARLIRSSFGPTVPLIGPSFASEWTLDGSIMDFVNTTHLTTIISFHKYGVNGCSKFVTLDNLLDSPAPNEYQYVSDLTAFSNFRGKRTVLSEGGSASCKGVPGISDVFGSALWTVDTLFEMAFRGVSRAFLSGSPQALYAPINVDGGVMSVRPGFYGMLLFNIAVGSGNSIVYRPGISSLRLKSWALYDAQLNVHTFVIIHKSRNGSEPCQITLPGAVQAQLIRLTSPSLTSTSGFSLAGYTFDQSTDGMPLGAYNESTIDAINSVFSFTALSGSATLLKIYLGKSYIKSPLVKFETENYPIVNFGSTGTGTRMPDGVSNANELILSLRLLMFVLSLALL